MTKTILILSALSVALATAGIAATQPAADDGRRDAITLLRAINTAEIAVKRTDGKYVPLTTLLDHRAMGGVKSNVSVNGNAVTYLGAEVRLALSGDAMQYVVTVVHGAPNYTAAFTDERGIIYTGKALE